jgi:hypothetical protein
MIKSLEDVSVAFEVVFAVWENTERAFEPRPYVEALRARPDDVNAPNCFWCTSGPSVGRQQAMIVRLASRVIK